MSRARILADYVAGGTTAAEFDYLDGVTSNVQTQLDRLPDQGVPHIIPSVLYPAVAGKLLDGSTSHGATYGVAQGDGRSYYYTDIKGSKPIKDPRIGAHFGSQRHKFKSIQLLEQETATHGENVYSFDGREWIRAVASYLVEINNDTGQNFQFGNNVSGDTEFIEIIGYFNQANILGYCNNFSPRTFTSTVVNGGTAHTTDTTFQTSVSTPLGSRYVDSGSLVKVEMETITSPQITTLKLVPVDAAQMNLYGIELIAQDTTSTTTKSQIQIPSQNVVSYGKKFTVAAAAHHYDPFNGFVNDTTLFASVVDMDTSLGLGTATTWGAAWDKGSDNHIRPYNGGRVVKWVDSSGVIKTSVNMMPPNAQNISTTAAAEITTPSATNTYLPAFSDDAVDHSQAEVAKTFHIREFGNGSANGNATYADPSTVVTDSGDDLAYVMDDGLTSFSGASGSSNVVGGHGTAAGSGIYTSTNSTSMYVTFMGTGLSGGIDNTSDSTRSGTITNVAQNLPYGTHILKLTRGTYPASTIHIDGVQVYSGSTPYTQIRELTFHQPKMPPIPEDAVVLADYMLMADFVPIGAEGIDRISKGVRVVSGTRDVFYDGGSPGFNLDVGNFMGMTISATNSTSNLSRITAFTPNVVKRLYNVDAREQAFYINDTAHSSADATTEDGSGHGSYQYPASVTLGNNIFETHGASGGATTYTHAYEIASPIHTSSHYQTFETPYLHELVGGDRNMEQTNLVVTPDGKTWDEVTRDVSYIGNFRWRASIESAQVSNTTNIPLDEHRGTYHNSTLNLGIKDFTWGYDRLICLVGGEYQINWTDVWDADATAQLMKITKNGAIVFRTENSHTAATPGTISVHLQLKRGDYVRFMGTYANNNDADNYPYSHWNIVKV